MTTPGRVTAAPRGGTGRDRETRIAPGPLGPGLTPWSPVATGPRGGTAFARGASHTLPDRESD